MGVGLRQWRRFLEQMGFGDSGEGDEEDVGESGLPEAGQESETEEARPADAFEEGGPGSVRQDAMDLRLLHPDWRYEEFQPAIEQRHGPLDRGALPDLWQWAGEQAQQEPEEEPAVEDYGEAPKFPLGRRGWATRTLEEDPSLIMDFGRFQESYGKTFGESAAAGTPESRLGDLWQWASDVTRTGLQGAGVGSGVSGLGSRGTETATAEGAVAVVPGVPAGPEAAEGGMGVELTAGPSGDGRLKPAPPATAGKPVPPAAGQPGAPPAGKPGTAPTGQQAAGGAQKGGGAKQQPKAGAGGKGQKGGKKANKPEPPPQNDMGALDAEFKKKLDAMVAGLEARGFDPEVFETIRTQERQDWLVDHGRSWTHHGKHLTGNAADVISKKNKWNDPKFFAALKEEAIKAGLMDAEGKQEFSLEGCHVQYVPPPAKPAGKPGAQPAGKPGAGKPAPGKPATQPAGKPGPQPGKPTTRPAGKPTAWLVGPPTLGEGEPGAMQVELTAGTGKVPGGRAAPARQAPAGPKPGGPAGAGEPAAPATRPAGGKALSAAQRKAMAAAVGAMTNAAVTAAVGAVAGPGAGVATGQAAGVAAGRAAEARPARTPGRGQEPTPSLSDPLEANVERWRAEVVASWPADLVEKALHVMQGESHGDPDQEGDTGPIRGVLARSYGLFQIRDLPNRWREEGYPSHEAFLRAIKDPHENIRIAAHIYQRYGWGPWTAAQVLGLAPPPPRRRAHTRRQRRRGR